MKMMSISNRRMNVKCLFAIHFICLAICAVLLFTLRRSEHLRWGLGYIVVWGTILSALLLCFLINKQLKHWLLLKIYCVVFEKLIATYYYPTADSIKVYEDKGAIVIYCSKDNFYTDSLGCIEPLYNHLADEDEIKALARDLKVDIDHKFFQF